MKKHFMYIFAFLLVVSITSCKKGKGGSTAPETLESKLQRIATFTIETANQGTTDVKTVFIVQSFTASPDKKTTITTYPQATKEGTWKVNSETAFDLVYTDGTINFTNVVIEGNKMTAKVNVPSIGGKTAAVEVLVQYNK